MFQYVLQNQEELQRLLPNQDDRDLITENFAKIYKMETEEQFKQVLELVQA